MRSKMSSTGGDSTGQILSSTVPNVGSPLFDASAKISEHVKLLVRSQMKAVGVRIWGGSPDQAQTNLARTLDGGRSARHFHVDWLDYIVEVLGPQAGLYIVNVLCERWGLEPTRIKPEHVVQEERYRQLEAKAEELLRANAALADELRMARGEAHP